MILSCCIIVKDDTELSELKKSVSSVVEYSDEIIIVANGEKVKNIEAFSKTNPKIKYFYLKWNKDFAEQRNFAASKIRSDADYYFWIDTDDVLKGGENLREIAIRAKQRNMDAVFFEYWYQCEFDGDPGPENILSVKVTQERERLLNPRSVTWKGRLHETLIPNENIDYKYTRIKYEDNPIVWVHLSTATFSLDEAVARTNRNKEILELQLDDERKTKEGADPRTLLYLMKIYAETQDAKTLTKCIEMGEEYLTKSGWDAERALCCSIMAKCLDKTGLVQDAKEFLIKSIGEYPFDPILHLELSRIYYHLNQFHQMKFWLDTALSIDPQKTASNITNIQHLKTLASELTMNYYLKGERNTKKSYKAAQKLFEVEPTAENKEKLDYLENMYKLDQACGHAHGLMLYYENNNNSRGVVDVVKSMPKEMQNLEFVYYYYNRHKTPRIWAKDEVCYYASFGTPHFEQWGPNSLQTGIGGSETAVIRLSQEWAKKGYKVVVYCDCGKEEGMHDGVLYLPYYKFNPRDSFNIFINWRSTHLAGRIKAKKILIDLHDLFNPTMVSNYQRYDKLMLKSKYHSSLATSVGEDKKEVISNGI